MTELEQIRTVLNSSAGQPLKKFLMAKVLELRNIDNIQEFTTPTTQALEIKAQKRAYKKLREIVESIMTFAEEPTPKDERDSFIV